jgi:hypothetical protein
MIVLSLQRLGAGARLPEISEQVMPVHNTHYSLIYIYIYIRRFHENIIDEVPQFGTWNSCVRGVVEWGVGAVNTGLRCSTWCADTVAS